MSKVLLIVIALLSLNACATVRTRWSLADSAFSESALKLPQDDLDQIVGLVSPALVKHIIAIGRACGPTNPESDMNVIVEYSDDGWWLYKLKKLNGHWRVIDQGILHIAFFRVWTGC